MTYGSQTSPDPPRTRNLAEYKKQIFFGGVTVGSTIPTSVAWGHRGRGPWDPGPQGTWASGILGFRKPWASETLKKRVNRNWNQRSGIG